MKILVVDDTQSNLEEAKIQLSEHKLTLANTFTEAMSLIKTTTFDVVLTDLMMPVENVNMMAHPDIFSNQLMPYGLLIALYVIGNTDTKVAIVSMDGDRHNHPIVSAADNIMYNNDGDFVEYPNLPKTSFYMGTRGRSIVERDGRWVKGWSGPLNDVLEKSKQNIA